MDGVWNWVLIAVVVLLLIALPIMMNARNKRETQKVQEQTNSLKVGDKVLTTSGVYGTITEIKFDDSKKTVVIETGGKIKSYMTVDAYAIYTVFKSDAELKREAEERERQQAEAERLKAEEEQAKKDAKKKKKAKTEVTAETQVVEAQDVAKAETTAEEAKVETDKTENTEETTSSKSSKNKK